MSSDSSSSSSSNDRPANRLAGETSPYLLLHRHNPVDWYPWGEEALERARSEDKPLFLSVGYSTCYWCHVMERESFSDPETARFMNERFVNVKVDREERPDLDEIYMVATQVLAGQGGWPNSVFLTPELRPFYAGTYYPPEDRPGRPGFRTVLDGLHQAWSERRDEVEMQAEEVASAMGRLLEERFESGERPAPAAAVVRAYEMLAGSYDARRGGFGRAPKFPTPSNLFLLQGLARDEGFAAAVDAGQMLHHSLDSMARGGLYDQLGGGFHRYSTDAAWRVPHFEKMLYDNGLLLEAYAQERERLGPEGGAVFERVLRRTAGWIAREMTDVSGAFWSALDAETEGHEGAFYVWDRAEIFEVLGDEDAAFLAPLYGFDGEPTFEGSWVLHRPEPLETQAARRRTDVDDLLADVEPLLERLFERRGHRERPLTDDKILADWNGMVVRGLAEAGRVLDDAALVAMAARAAEAVLDLLRPGGAGLLHSARGGEAKIPAYLADYVFLVRGLLGLHRATLARGGDGDDGGDDGAGRWLELARELTEEQDERLAHPDGGFYNAAEDPHLLFRSQEVFDGATPGANAVAVENLLELAEASGDDGYLDRAERALAAFSPLLERAPGAVRSLALANWRYHRARGGGDLTGEEVQRPDKPEAEDLTGQSIVSVRLGLGDAGPDGDRPFRLELSIAPPWHLNAHPASADHLVPTAVEGADGVEVLEVRYPEGTRARLGDEEISVYEGTVAIDGRLRGNGRLVLSYQPCDDRRCLPPVRGAVPVRG